MILINRTKVCQNNICLFLIGGKSFSTNLVLLSDKGKGKATQEDEEKWRKEEQNRDIIKKEEGSEDSIARSEQERYDEEYAYYLQKNDMEQRYENLSKTDSQANTSELYNTSLAGPSNTNNTQDLADPSNTNNTQDLAGPSNTNNSNIKYVDSEHFNYLMEVNEEEQEYISGLKEEISEIQVRMGPGGDIQDKAWRESFEDLIDLYREQITEYEECISLRNHMVDPENTPVPKVSFTSIRTVNEQFEWDIVNERTPTAEYIAAELEAYTNIIRRATYSELADSEDYPNDPKSSNPLETSSEDSLSSSEEQVQQSERNTSQEESNNKQEQIQYSSVKQDITEQEKIKFSSDEDSEKLQEFFSDKDSEGQENQSPSVELNSTEVRNPSFLEQKKDPDSSDIFSDVLYMFEEEEKNNEESDNTNLESVHSSPISNNADVENDKNSNNKKNNDEEDGSDESGSNGAQDNGPSDDVGKSDIDSSNKRSLLIADLIINLINCIFGTDNNDDDDYHDNYYL